MLQLEVAGTVIQMNDGEGTLVFYADCQYKGQTVTVHYSRVFENTVGDIKLTASVVERSIGSGTVCAAIFPRILMDIDDLPQNVYVEDDFFKYPATHISVYGGNVTEVYLKRWES